MTTSQIITFALFLLSVATFGWWIFPKKKIQKTTVFPDAWRAILDEKV